MIKKRLILFTTILVLSSNFVFIIPENVYAESTQEEICDNNPACKQSSSVLGDVNCECSVAWLLQKFLNYIRILGPTLAILFGSIDYVKAIISSDENNMQKTGKEFLYRLIAALALFLVPTIVQVLLSLFGITSDVATGGLS